MAVPSLPIPKDPDQCVPWLYDVLHRVRVYLVQQDEAITAIGRGESPDGSGQPLPPGDLTQYFFLPGRIGGQVAYGGSNDGNNLTLGSTTATTKGFIYLGVTPPRVAINETLGRMGIATEAPLAQVHTTSATGTLRVALRPISTQSSSGYTATGAATIHDCIDDVTTDEDTTYARGTTTTPSFEVKLTTGLNLSSWVRARLVVRVRHEGVTPNPFIMALTIGSLGTLIAQFAVNSGMYNAGYKDMVYYLTAAELTALKAADSSNLFVNCTAFDNGFGAQPMRITQLFVDNDEETEKGVLMTPASNSYSSPLLEAASTSDRIKVMQVFALGGPAILRVGDYRDAAGVLASQCKIDVQGSTSQTSPLQTWSIANSGTISQISAAGTLGIGIATNTPGAMAHVKQSTASAVAILAEQGVTSAVAIQAKPFVAGWTGSLFTALKSDGNTGISIKSGGFPSDNSTPVLAFHGAAGAEHFRIMVNLSSASSSFRGGIYSNANDVLIEWVRANFFTDAVATTFIQLGFDTAGGGTTRYVALTGNSGGNLFNRLAISVVSTAPAGGNGVIIDTTFTTFTLIPAAILHINNTVRNDAGGAGNNAAVVLRASSARTGQTGDMFQIASAVASTVDNIWNARNVHTQGRIKALSGVLLTDDNATISLSRLAGFSTSLVAQGATRVLGITDRDGNIATDANVVVDDAGNVVTYAGNIVLA